MTDIQRAGIIKALIRASDALHNAFQQAAAIGNLDLAADLRKQSMSVGAMIRTVSGPIPSTLRHEVLS